jgi:hypothetical protein
MPDKRDLSIRKHADLRFTRNGANVALYEGSIGGSSPILDLLSDRNCKSISSSLTA